MNQGSMWKELIPGLELRKFEIVPESKKVFKE